MKLRLMILAVCAAFIAAGCAKKDAGADAGMNAKADSMKNAYKAISVAWDAGNVAEFDKYVSGNLVDHDQMPGKKPGLEGMKDMANMLKTAYPDMKSTTQDMRVDGDVLTARFSVSGTNTGPMMMGMPATNKKMTDVDGIDMWRWENGKFVERWGVFNAMKMMMQLGLMPPPGGAPARDMGKPMDKPADTKKM